MHAFVVEYIPGRRVKICPGRLVEDEKGGKNDLRHSQSQLTVKGLLALTRTTIIPMNDLTNFGGIILRSEMQSMQSKV